MEIFRKSALDKISSPEQLDKMIVVTSPKIWLVTLGGLIIVAATVIWGIFGELPENVETTGIILAGEGTGVTYSDVSGIVDDVCVEIGQYVEKGQIVARVDMQTLLDDIKTYDVRIDGVEKVTLDSEGDVSTADNKSLVDIKSELLPLMSSLNQAQRNLDIIDKEIALQESLVNVAQNDMNEKKLQYYASINDKSGAREQADYSEWQTNYNSTLSYVESIKQNVASSKVGVEEAEIQRNVAEDSLNKSALKTTLLKQQYDAQNAKLNELNEQLMEEKDEKAIEELLNEIEEQSKIVDEAYQAYQDSLVETESVKSNYETASNNLDMAVAQYDTMRDLYDSYSGRLSYEGQQYENSKNSLINYQDAAAVVNKYNNMASNEFSLASNIYSTEKSKLDSLKQGRITAQVDVENAKEQIETKKAVIEKNFNATKEAILDSLNLEKDKIVKNSKRAEIVSTQTGYVKEVVVSPGSALSTGGEVVKVISGDSAVKHAVCYVPIEYGKKIRPDMDVMIYPTVVNKQESGHMVGKVTSVDVFVTSQAELMKHVGDVTLAETFLKNGPVVEVVCEIKMDESTASGYYWSSSKGRDVQIDTGTIFNASIAVEKKAPISLIIPILKEKLTVKPLKQDN